MTVLTRVSQPEMKRRTGFGGALGYALPEEDEILIREDLPKKLEKEVIEHEEEHILKGEEGPFLGSIIGAATSIFGAHQQSKSAKKAAKAQRKAAQAEIDFAKESRDLARADAAPYREAGYKALDALMSMTGLAAPASSGGGGSDAPVQPNPALAESPRAGDYLAGLRGPFRRALGRAYGGPIYGRMGGGGIGQGQYLINEDGPENVTSGGEVTRTPNPQAIEPGADGYVQPNENPGGIEGGFNFQTDPGYEFRLNEGQRVLERGAAAAGGLLSGGYGRRAIRYGQDYASNEYSNVYNRIANIAGLGQVSSGRSANAALYASGQVGGALSNAGAARASGYTAQGNVWGGAIRDLGQLPWDDWLGGSSSPSGGGSGGGWGRG